MMRKSILIGFLLALSLCEFTTFAQSSMTDKQVLDYAKQGIASGKSANTVSKELLAKGVTREQAARVKKLYDNENGGTSESTQNGVDNTDRSHTFEVFNGSTDFENQYNETDSLDENRKGATGQKISNEIYGRSIFRNKNLTFAPSANMPTPQNYVLGPSDEVIVDIFGANQNTIRSKISPEGYINIDVLGPVYLSGKTIESANTYLKNKLSSIYNGLTGEDAESSDIQLSLGQIRSIQVSIIGDVPNPGTYTISSLSTAFNAMFQAGGVSGPGTIRNIKVVRKNKQIAVIDIYDFLINGNRKNDVRLEDGDVILVEPYEKVVSVKGFVKRPMKFELKGAETLKDVLKYAGGFETSANRSNATVIRIDNISNKVFTIDANDFGSFVLNDGDSIKIDKVESRYDNRISIMGSVYIPGVYELSSELNTVRKLVKKAGGLQPEAFTQRAVINRQHNDLTLETVAVDLDGIMNGRSADVPLENNDELYISSIYEIEDQGTLTIRGEVANPGTFPFASNTSVKDLILKAGGLLRSASVVKIDVARRISDPQSLVAKEDISEYHTFSMTDGYSFDGAETFVLEPYDVVTVRRSPAYVDGKVIHATGEFNFPGDYNMNKRVQRVSDLVALAGGLTDFAYIEGARLRRTLTPSEQELRNLVIQNVTNNGDSVAQDSITASYMVALDLKDAINHPNGKNDIVLREGDIVEVPVYNNTVSIMGAVQMSTSVTYHQGIHKHELINDAGGFTKRACKHKAYIVYMNGRVSRLRRFTTIKPGSQILVPAKEKKPSNLGNVMSIATSAASLGMMGVSIANLLK